MTYYVWLPEATGGPAKLPVLLRDQRKRIVLRFHLEQLCQQIMISSFQNQGVFEIVIVVFIFRSSLVFNLERQDWLNHALGGGFHACTGCASRVQCIGWSTKSTAVKCSPYVFKPYLPNVNVMLWNNKKVNLKQAHFSFQFLFNWRLVLL